ncbi:DNA alkylation repair protein [Deferribacterales bacterium RsTz2092]|nr:DNA alkylation repair protein [Deferribacterales bacterium]
MNHTSLINALKSAGDAQLMAHHAKFFQTHKGGYGEGDKFIGLTVPATREIAKPYINLPHNSIAKLLQNDWHEVRFAALVIIIARMNEEPDAMRTLYAENVDYINNWDLVDLSADKVLGRYYRETNGQKGCYRGLLNDYANSGMLWRERISVVATFYQLNKYGETDLTVKRAEHFLTHKHDLMHKATGWAMREVGKKDRQSLITFLNKYATVMPRTMLRYSIEHLPPEQRKHYMGMK